MLGEHYEIHIDPGAKPFAIFTPRQVPFPICERVNELLWMESQGVISKVEQPTPWCVGMVVVLKS